jgi:2-keto-3-deoxy-L-rhamnonate aldolase RhmA
VHTTWPNVVEALALTGCYDYVEFVAEYGAYDLYAFDDFCRAAELHDLGTMIKVEQEPRSWIASRAIGSGFQSVLFSDPRTVDDAKECVAIARPETPEDGGTYGVATRRITYMGYGGGPDYVQHLRDIVIMLMIEKQGAVEQLEQILQVPGVDMIQWGPADYSMSVGKAGQGGSPEIKSIERRVVEASLAAGVQPRAEINTPDAAKYYLDMGVRHFCMATDINILHGWWKANGEELRRAVEG